MDQQIKNKSCTYKNLLRLVSESSGYHMYEVKDVIDHMIGNMQKLLEEGTDVKLSGIGSVRCKKMHVKNTVNGQKLEYTTHRLSIVADLPMKRYLKESYEKRSSKT